MSWLLDQGFDAVFVGSGAPRGKELELPGRHDTDHIYIGIDWLESVAFGHTNSIEENVLVIGVGNTAMDCCRTSKRIGGSNVKVMARKSKPYFKASPWELEDAEEELVDIMENHSPTEFVVEDGVLKGMNFDIVEWHPDENGRLKAKKLDDVFLPADAVILAIGQETAFPWIEDDVGPGSSSTNGARRSSTRRRSCRRARASSSAATRRGGRRTSSGPWSTVIRRRSPFMRTAMERT